MKKKLRELLTAIATDSRVLADYQDDPKATRNRYGVSKREMEDLVELLGGKSSISVPDAGTGPIIPASTTKPVTH